MRSSLTGPPPGTPPGDPVAADPHGGGDDTDFAVSVRTHQGDMNVHQRPFDSICFGLGVMGERLGEAGGRDGDLYIKTSQVSSPSGLGGQIDGDRHDRSRNCPKRVLI
eukprot:229223-Rhodomonas_salina.2